jgi:hypothetical protein
MLNDTILNNALLVIKNYLNAMEERDLLAAQTVLSKNIIMYFPGNKIFYNLEEVIEWTKSRYNWTKKNYDRFDPLIIEDTVIVYCYGTLYGEWINCSEFSNIRFIDRFSIKNNKIIEQMVWNDLAEFKQIK